MQNTHITLRKWISAIVPSQHTGVSAVSKSHLECHSRQESLERYAQAAAALLDINQWHELAGSATAVFHLFDAQGVPVDRPAREGDFICIDVPGPGNPDGGGKDWVQVDKIGSKDQGELALAYLTVKVTANPFQETAATTAHFFGRPATSTFLVYRENLTIRAAVYGRNESPNLHTGNWLARIRNWLLYIGSRLGFSNAQWKSLTRGLLKVKQANKMGII